MNGKNIMFIGIGNLGSQVLDMFLRVPGKHKIVVAGRNQEYLHQRTNLATLAAVHLGRDPDVSYTGVDLWDIDQTADTISRIKPDIIFSSVTLQAGWVITTLPKKVFEELDRAQLGPWLPMQLTLMHKLMQAVVQTGLAIKVINSSYPDVVNPVLDRVGLAPTVGIGNVANNIPGLRKAIAYNLKKPLEQVEVRVVMHHYVSHRIHRKGNAGGAPFQLIALVNGEDLTHLLEVETVFDLLSTRFKRLGGIPGQLMTAASAITLLDAMANNIEKIVHAPGPNGLPGGYPVKVDEQAIEVSLPSGLSLEHAIDINEEAQRFDGIERIEKDGTVFFTDRAMSIMKDLLGYECKQMVVPEAEDRAKELRVKFLEFARKFQ